MALTKSPREVYEGSPADPAYQPVPSDATRLTEEMRAEYMAMADGQNRLASADRATTGNITLSGEQSIDGATTSASRVLVKNQSTASQNGIYVSGAGAWTRATDADTSAEIALAFVHVIAGTVNAGKRFQVVNSPTLGVDAVTWAEVGFNADLAAETLAREEADDDLADALTAEISAREAADDDLAADLAAGLTAEISAREAADDDLAADLAAGLALKRNIADPIDDAQLQVQPEGTIKGRRAGAGDGTVQQITLSQLATDMGLPANQSALEAAITAANQAREDADDALADDIAAEIEARIAADALLAARDDDLSSHWRQPAPGLNPADFRTGLAVNSSRYTTAALAATSAGSALRVTGPAYVVTGALVPVSSVDVDTLYFSVRRAVEVVDPAGDAIRFGVACYDGAGQYLSFAALGSDLDDLNDAGAIHERSGTVSRNAGSGASIILPENCVYYAPAVRVFGENPGTDVLQVERQRGATGAGGSVMVANAAGLVADLGDYDDEAEGFTFVAIDGDPPEYYFRTGAAGNWAGPLTFRGPAGADGAVGFATHADALEWLTENVIADGTTFECGGVPFTVEAAAEVIDTLPGAKPRDFVSPDHFGGKDQEHIEAAWAYVCTLCATSTSSLLPANTAMPFVLIGGRYNTDATEVVVLTTAGAFQRVEFRNGARAYHLSFDTVHRSAEYVDPFIIGGTYDMDFGIRFGGNTTTIRQGWVLRPRMYNIQNADYDAAAIAFQNDAAQFEVTDGWFYGNDHHLTGRRGPDSTTASGGVLVNGCQMFAARRHNALISSNGEWKFNNIRARTAAREGFKIVGSASSKALECYWTDSSITGNHTDLTNRQQYTITAVTDNGSGKARLAVATNTYLWRGLRNLQIGGTTIYDGTNIRVYDMGSGWVDTNLDYIGNATGTLYHCGYDFWAECDVLANTNDLSFTGGNINSFGASKAYNLSFTNCRLKVNAWLQDCNNVIRIGYGLRGREDDAFEDVPFSGNTVGCYEIGTSIPEGGDRNTVPSLIMRYPDAAAGFAKGLPVAYGGFSGHPTDGVMLMGKVKMRDLPTYANNAAAVSGGLAVDYLYATASGEVRVVV